MAYPNTTNASDVWSLRDVYKAEASDEWPLINDPNFANVNLLVNADGQADGSTSISDVSNTHTINVFGNAQVDTSIFKYGTGSILLDGTGDYFRTSSDISIGTSTAFTIECWAYAFDITQDQAIFGRTGTTPNVQLLRLNHAGDTGKVMAYSGSYIVGNSQNNALSGIANNEWFHIALTREGTNLCKLFVNGDLKETNTNFTASVPIDTIGAGYTGDSNPFNGHLDDIRITIGVARYTANFTPPTSAFKTA